jgi:hypothetical protein
MRSLSATARAKAFHSAGRRKNDGRLERAKILQPAIINGELMELPFKFPDPLEEAARRAEEFQRLPTHERLRQLMDVVRTAVVLLQYSPHRVTSDRLFLQREADWQRIQRELIVRHGA